MVHIHFPEGASKKDGPSAGGAITSSLMSLALNKQFKKNYAMTGEISLNGKILKIGGLKEKLLAAKREGIDNVFVPKSNKNDLYDIEEKIFEGLNIIYVENYSEIASVLFDN